MNERLTVSNVIALCVLLAAVLIAVGVLTSPIAVGVAIGALAVAELLD